MQAIAKRRFGTSKFPAAMLGLWLGVLGLSVPSAAQTQPPLTLTKTIPLEGYSGAFDHFAYDPDRHRFFLAAEDHGTVDVFDLLTGSHLQTLPGFDKPHNIVVQPGAPTILVVDSGPSKSQLLDAVTYRTLKSLPLEIGANATLYDAQRARLYITTGGDRVQSERSTLIAVDPDTGDVLKSVALPSIHLQPLALDTAANRIFVNLADKDTVAVVDRDSFRLLDQWPTGAAKRNSAIAFDGVNHRLFVVGEPGAMAVLNSDTGKITNTVSIPADADDLAFDEVAHRLYIPGGDGFLGVYDTTDPEQVKEVARIATRKEARTGMLIPSEHKYLLAASEIDGNAAAVMMFDVR
jgi:DNA-binding beta-propeller fold protein YncE